MTDTRSNEEKTHDPDYNKKYTDMMNMATMEIADLIERKYPQLEIALSLVHKEDTEMFDTTVYCTFSNQERLRSAVEPLSNTIV